MERGLGKGSRLTYRTRIGIPQRTGRLQGSESNQINILNTHLLVAQVQELVELNTTVGESTERPLLLEVGGDLGVGNGGISLQSVPRNVPSALPHRPPHHNTASALTILRMSLAVLRWRLEGSLLAVFGTESELRRVAGRLLMLVGILLYSSQPPARGRLQ